MTERTTQNSVPSDGFDCIYLYENGREVGCLNGPQSDPDVIDSAKHWSRSAAIAALPAPAGESVTVDTIAQIIAEKIDVLELTHDAVVSVTGIKEAAEAIFATITRKSEARS